MAGAVDRAGVGGSCAGHPRFRAWHRRSADRSGARGEPDRHSAASHGRDFAADAARARARGCAICCCRPISPRSACGWNRCACCRRLPRERRIAFCNGLSVGFMAAATGAGFAGYYLAAELPPLLGRGAVFSHADVVPGVDRAQCQDDDGQDRAGARTGDRHAAHRRPCPTRSYCGPASAAARSLMPFIGSARRPHERRPHRVMAVSVAGAARLSAERGLAGARPGAGARAERGIRRL